MDQIKSNPDFQWLHTYWRFNILEVRTRISTENVAKNEFSNIQCYNIIIPINKVNGNKVNNVENTRDTHP